jgi:hypothetical protein
MVFSRCKATKGVKAANTEYNNQKDAKYVDVTSRQVVENGIAYDINWGTEQKVLKAGAPISFSGKDGKITCEAALTSMNAFAPGYVQYLATNADEAVISSTDPASQTSAPEETKTCASEGGSLGWIACPTYEGIAAAVNGVYQMILDQFNYKNLTDDNSRKSIQGAWENFRNYANVG